MPGLGREGAGGTCLGEMSKLSCVGITVRIVSDSVLSLGELFGIRKYCVPCAGASGFCAGETPAFPLVVFESFDFLLAHVFLAGVGEVVCGRFFPRMQEYMNNKYTEF